MSKTDKSDPKRLRKDLPKLVKNIAPEDQMMLIGAFKLFKSFENAQWRKEHWPRILDDVDWCIEIIQVKVESVCDVVTFEIIQVKAQPRRWFHTVMLTKV